MIDLSVIILTFNEELHIRRCLENVLPFAKKIYVIDCFSTDKTKEIASKLGADVVEHSWPGNQAEQFNWALENLPIDTRWVLRLDADEYLLPELVNELQDKLPSLPKDVTGIIFKRRHIFMGIWMRRGIYPVKLLRLFRYGKGLCEQRLMDEHLSILSGDTIEMQNQFVDDNRMPIGVFINKHNGYASREAALLLDAEFHLTNTSDLPQDYGEEVIKKRAQKARYARMPLFWRAFAYFVYRYIFKLGFLDGKEGFLWDFLQGWWYRTLVDAKVFEVKRACGNDKEKIRQYLKEQYGIVLE